MTSFVVFSHDGVSDEYASDKTMFVRDAFSVWALAAPVIWLLWHRLWVHAFVAICASIVILSLAQSPTLVFAILPLNLLLGILVALEGPSWRMASLRHKNYAEHGVVEAETLEDAQIIWAMGAHENRGESAMLKASAKRTDSQPSNLIFGGAI